MKIKERMRDGVAILELSGKIMGGPDSEKFSSTLKQLIHEDKTRVIVDLGNEARRRIAESQELIDDVVAHGETIYGVNTGFGQLASVRISDDELALLQENLVRSHAVGVGIDLDDDIVRLIMLMKVIALAEGFSGVRLELVEALCALINNEIYPRIPSKGSVGASGDLAPLAHMAGALIGIGEVRVNGHLMPAAAALRQAGIEPVQLAPKEGLALLNGTQAATALALAGAGMPVHTVIAGLGGRAITQQSLRGVLHKAHLDNLEPLTFLDLRHDVIVEIQIAPLFEGRHGAADVEHQGNTQWRRF